MMGNMMLAAHALGLGSCWINRAKEVFETEEGGITAFFRDAVTEKDLEQVRSALTGFYDKWNTEQEEKIHYIDKVKKGKKSVRATIDFGGCPKEAVIGMIESLRDCNGIKKVVYK